MTSHAIPARLGDNCVHDQIHLVPINELHLRHHRILALGLLPRVLQFLHDDRLVFWSHLAVITSGNLEGEGLQIKHTLEGIHGTIVEILVGLKIVDDISA